MSQTLRVHIPADAFVDVEKNADALVLRGKDRARGLGPDATDHVFSITLRRPATSAETLVAAPPPARLVPGRDLLFPKRTLASFVTRAAEPVTAGTSFTTKLLARPAYVWVNGVEGYDQDVALVDLGPKESLVAVAEWNTAIMMGQPECWQRQVIGGVLESVELVAPSR